MPLTTAAPAHAATDPRAAFDRLFRAEYPRVVAIALRILGDAGEAEDVAQEVFLQLHRRHSPHAGFAPAWLHAAAAHSALNVIRARHRRESRERRWMSGAPPSEDPAERAVATDTARRLRAAMGHLSQRHASALALRNAGLSYAEVADALGIRASHVGTLLRRAETALRKEIGDAAL
ncbi:MAG TPA: sigma-70 family RNA polymerase sigma factor [Candidatus Binatia bacterium]|nr:sigma-70 family RNA polymerase sigma factor [Candidatus Binatia bacterium]